MARRKKDFIALQAEIELREQALAEAKAKMREAETEEASRIGRIALKAGALDHNLSDAQWLALFEKGLASLGNAPARSAPPSAS